MKIFFPLDASADRTLSSDGSAVPHPKFFGPLSHSKMGLGIVTVQNAQATRVQAKSTSIFIPFIKTSGHLLAKLRRHSFKIKAMNTTGKSHLLLCEKYLIFHLQRKKLPDFYLTGCRIADSIIVIEERRLIRSNEGEDCINLRLPKWHCVHHGFPFPLQSEGIRVTGGDHRRRVWNPPIQPFSAGHTIKKAIQCRSGHVEFE